MTEISSTIEKKFRRQQEKLACVYDSSIVGELDIVNAYFDAWGIDKSYIVGVDLSDSINTSQDTMWSEWLLPFHDMVVANNVFTVCCGPNCPDSIDLFFGNFSTGRTAFSKILGIVRNLKLFMDGKGYTELSDSTQISGFQGVAYLGTMHLSLVDYTDGVEQFEGLDGALRDEDITSLEIDGIDIGLFTGIWSTTLDSHFYWPDMPHPRTNRSETILRMACFRIGWRQVVNAPVMDVAAIQLMVANSKAKQALSFAHHKENSPIVFSGFDRTNLITTSECVAMNHLLDEIGYTATKFGYHRGNSQNLDNTAGRTVGDTGLLKYQRQTPVTNVNISHTFYSEVPSAEVIGSYHRYDDLTGLSGGEEFIMESHNGNAFPLNTFLHFSQITNFETVNDGGLYLSTAPNRTFNIQAGGIIIGETSHHHRISGAAFEAGASVVYASFYEPLDSGVGGGSQFVLGLLRGHRAATAACMTADWWLNEAELWGDGWYAPYPEQAEELPMARKNIFSFRMAAVRSSICSATLSNAGTGFADNEELNFTSPTGDGAMIRVLTQSAGVVQTFRWIAGGIGYRGGEVLTYASGSAGGAGLTITLGALTGLADGYFNNAVVEQVDVQYRAIVGGVIVNNQSTSLNLSGMDDSLPDLVSILSYVAGNSFGNLAGVVQLNWIGAVAEWPFGDALTIVNKEVEHPIAEADTVSELPLNIVDITGFVALRWSPTSTPVAPVFTQGDVIGLDLDVNELLGAGGPEIDPAARTARRVYIPVDRRNLPRR